MNRQALRNRYMSDAVATVSPQRLVTMLYDALVRDLAMADAALARCDLATVSDRLVHAQDIVLELASGLKESAWEGGAALKQLYVFLYQEMVEANVQKDGAKIAACRAIVEPLASAWHEAAGTAAASVAGRQATA